MNDKNKYHLRKLRLFGGDGYRHTIKKRVEFLFRIRAESMDDAIRLIKSRNKCTVTINSIRELYDDCGANMWKAQEKR